MAILPTHHRPSPNHTQTLADLAPPPYPQGARVYDSQTMAYLHGFGTKIYNLGFKRALTAGLIFSAGFGSLGFAGTAIGASLVRRDGLGPCYTCDGWVGGQAHNNFDYYKLNSKKEGLKSEASRLQGLANAYKNRISTLSQAYGTNESYDVPYHPEILQAKIDEVNAQFAEWGLIPDTEPEINDDYDCQKPNSPIDELCFAIKNDDKDDSYGFHNELGYDFVSIHPLSLSAAKALNLDITFKSSPSGDAGGYAFNNDYLTKDALSKNHQTYAALEQALAYAHTGNFQAQLPITVYRSGEPLKRSLQLYSSSLVNQTLLPLSSLPCQDVQITKTYANCKYECSTYTVDDCPPLFNANSTLADLKNISLSLAPNVTLLDLLQDKNGSNTHNSTHLGQRFGSSQTFIDFNKTILAPLLPQMHQVAALLNAHGQALKDGLKDAFIKSGGLAQEINTAKQKSADLEQQSADLSAQAKKLPDNKKILQNAYSLMVSSSVASVVLGIVASFGFCKGDCGNTRGIIQDLFRSQVHRLPPQALAMTLRQPAAIPTAVAAPVIEEV